MTATPPEYDPVAALSSYLGAASGDAAYVESCAVEAEALVAELLADVVWGTSAEGATWDSTSGTWDTAGGPPVELRRRAVLEVGADLYHRKAAKNGISTFGDNPDVPPIRIRRDPLDPARALLVAYLPGGFA